MRPHVLPEVGALYEGLRALRANERLLAGVGAVVRVPRRLVAESNKFTKKNNILEEDH